MKYKRAAGIFCTAACDLKFRSHFIRNSHHWVTRARVRACRSRRLFALFLLLSGELFSFAHLLMHKLLSHIIRPPTSTSLGARCAFIAFSGQFYYSCSFLARTKSNGLLENALVPITPRCWFTTLPSVVARAFSFLRAVKHTALVFTRGPTRTYFFLSWSVTKISSQGVLQHILTILCFRKLKISWKMKSIL